jgi:hypothetical protein
MLAMKKSITPRKGPTRMMASATHRLSSMRELVTRGATERRDTGVLRGKTLSMLSDAVEAGMGPSYNFQTNHKNS